ncbi:MAG: ComF family protein [bacterium]
MDKERIRGKRLLLIDDILTTGATASECTRTLLMARAEEVSCASVAHAMRQK